MTERPFAHPVLILFAHPALQKSRVNRQLMHAVRDLEGVTFHDLYEVYPDFHIDVRHEQDLLAQHDIIVFQYPLYWFSVPALLKMWEELVLEHKWAYGKEGAALRGKKLMSALSTGGRESLFCREGFNRCTIREYLEPVEQLARICGMEYLPPFVVHGTRELTGPEIGRHADDYRRVIAAIRDGRIDWDAARSFPRLNTDLDAVIRK